MPSEAWGLNSISSTQPRPSTCCAMTGGAMRTCFDGSLSVHLFSRDVQFALHQAFRVCNTPSWAPQSKIV